MSNDEATQLEALASQSRAAEKRRRVDHKKEWYVAELAKCRIALADAEGRLGRLAQAEARRAARGFWARVFNVRCMAFDSAGNEDTP